MPEGLSLHWGLDLISSDLFRHLNINTFNPPGSTVHLCHPAIFCLILKTGNFFPFSKMTHYKQSKCRNGGVRLTPPIQEPLLQQRSRKPWLEQLVQGLVTNSHSFIAEYTLQAPVFPPPEEILRPLLAGSLSMGLPLTPPQPSLL